jgi:RNA polymerase sigma factor (TIGR02999 family)
MTEPGEITVLLRNWREGDEEAFQRLMPLAYAQLHAQADRYLRHERGGHTLQATALVHEVYLRLVRQRKAELTDRSHFYAFSAQLMRMILVDHARQMQAGKRGGGAQHIPLNEEMSWVNAGGPEMIELDRALVELEALDAEKARMVEYRYLLGCTAEEAAELLGCSKATLDRGVRFARSWLYRRLRGMELAP